MTPVPILIANYHGGDTLRLCVESIRRYTPEWSYRIIVGNDRDIMQTDNAYLRECRDKGWLEYVNAPERLHHGGILNILWNETDLGGAEYAVNLDNDTQVLTHGWLGELTAPLVRDPLAVAVCNARPFNVVSTQGYVPPFYQFWFAAMSVPRYREMGDIDWRFAYADRRDYPYSEMFRDVERMDLPQKRSSDFDDNRVAIDPGCKLWVKVHWDNPKGYRVLPIPHGMSAKYRHIGHVSHFVDVPDDYDDYTRREKRTRREFVIAELERLRCRA
jgi:hypothetical protein